MWKTLTAGAVLALSLTACGNQEASFGAAEFAALDHKAAVLKSHEWYKNEAGIVVRIHPDRINATFANGSEANVAIPQDQFFLSIAPWATFTHPCGNHVPTGCTGELIGETMHMSAVDVDSGEEILNQMITTQHDGFIDFWVPAQRNLEFTFHYEHPQFGWLEAKEVLPTFEDSRTCITTMQLKSMHSQNQSGGETAAQAHGHQGQAGQADQAGHEGHQGHH